MRFKFYAVLLILLIPVYTEVLAQTGKEFWFVIPEVSSRHNDAGLTFRFTNVSNSAVCTVTVSMPAKPHIVFAPIVINPGSTQSLVLDGTTDLTDSVENKPTNTLLNNGIYITSTELISAYYEVNNSNNNEIFALKGANALGYEFYIPLTNNPNFQNHAFPSPPTTNRAYATFDIVATEDNTTIQIFTRVPVDGHAANTSFNITLDKGQTYSCGFTGANYYLPSTHPSGAVVMSDKPIAITVKDDSDHTQGVQTDCYDLIGDQIVPVDIIGTDYIVIKGQLDAGRNESFYVLATENNTKVYVNGNTTPVANLFAGEQYYQNVTNPRYYVQTSKPAYCTHVTGFGCELGSALLPPLNCAGSAGISFVRSTDEDFYLNIMIKNGAQDAFKLNGDSTLIQAADFDTVPGTNGLWVSTYGKSFDETQVPVTTAMRITNSKDVFAMGLINGGGATGCRYGYFSEFMAPIIVDAGANQIVCANDTAELSGLVSGGAITGEWTTSGTGTFQPNNTDFDVTYIPSVADILAGFVDITLTSTGICFPVSDMTRLTFTAAPLVDAGTDISICANNTMVQLNGSVTEGATKGIWTGGTGTYDPDSVTVNAKYYPSAAELAAGFFTLTLTSLDNGNCNPESDDVDITILPAPTVNAGLDKSVCSNNALVTLSGNVTNAAGGIWSGGSGSWDPGSNAVSVNYIPTPAEISLGSLTLTLTSSGHGSCNAVFDQVNINFTSTPVAMAGTDISVCANNAHATLAGNVTTATGGTWSGGLGAFSTSPDSLNTVYTLTAGEILNGYVNMILTTTGNGNCTAVRDTVRINVTPAPTVDAGLPQTVCANNAAIQLAGAVTIAGGAAWSGGAGGYSTTATDVAAIYTPTLVERNAGSVKLYLTTTNNGTCNAVADSVTFTISPSPTVNAGADKSACSNNAAVTLAGSVTNATGVIWSGGAGSWNPGTNAQSVIYTPSPAEVAVGSLTLTLTSDGHGNCNAVFDQVNINFTSTPVAMAGTDMSVCANNAHATLAGNVTTATGGTWSGGLGAFSTSPDSLNTVYTLTAGEILNGYVNMILTTTGNGNCTAVRDTVRINVTPAPTVDAGLPQTVCANNAAIQLAGAVAIAGGAAWSGGAGGYSTTATDVAAIYTPTLVERNAGSVKLYLTTTNNGTCNAVADSVTFTISPSPTVNAGADQSACSNNAAVTLAGTVTNATGVIWSGGAGSWNPGTNAQSVIYTPSPAEVAVGSLTLTLTSDGHGTCNAVNDQVKISFTATPDADAGLDVSVCANNANASLAGAVTTATGGSWSGGLGVFTPSPDSLDVVYTPTNGEIQNGSVNLILTTTGNGNCNAVKDTVRLSVSPAPTAEAGPTQTVCANNAKIILAGAYTVAGGAQWSGGSGTYEPGNTTMSATYTPSLLEKTNGSAKLFLTTVNNDDCAAVLDSVQFTILQAPVVQAGADDTVCYNNPQIFLNGLVSGITNKGRWTGGLGTYAPNDSTLNAVYTPSAAEIASGFVNLTLRSTGHGSCLEVTDAKTIIITPPPVANAGIDQIKCSNKSDIVLNGSVSIAKGGQWSGGLGQFIPNNTTLNATYKPTSTEIANGSVDLVLQTILNGGCSAVSDTMQISFTPAPSVNAGENQTVCANNKLVTLNGSRTVATGSQWSNGTGIFLPDQYTLNATYNPSAAEVVAGKVVLYITTTGNGQCNAVLDSVTITVTPAPVVDAGVSKSACANNPTVILNGTVTGGSSTGIWSGGAGVFNPSTSSLNVIYTPTSQEISSGNVTLTLLSTNNSSNCIAVSDQTTISFTLSTQANAGVDQTICTNNSDVSLNGAVSVATGGQWSGGLGQFVPNSTTLNAVYKPSTEEKNNGSARLILSTTGNGGCMADMDTLQISITAAPVVDAGIDKSVCANNALTPVNGSVSIAAGGVWSSAGSGSFVNQNALATSYIPGATDKQAGSVVLRLTSTGNGNCLAVKDSFLLTISPAPVVNAGADTVVSVDKLNVSVNGMVTGGATKGSWTTSGSGYFTPSSSSLNAVYHVSSADSIAGMVTLTLTATDTGKCISVSDNKIIHVLPAGITDAGPDQTVCANKASITLQGSITGGATTGYWRTSGSGHFVPDSTTLNAQYVPSAQDTAAHSVTLTLRANSYNLSEDQMLLTINQAPIVNAGADKSVCVNNADITVNTILYRASGVQWSGGQGTFSPSSSTTNITYTPSANEKLTGGATLIVTTTGNGLCNAVVDTLKLTVTPQPIVNAGSDQVLCANNAAVSLHGLVQIGTSTGKWTSTGTGMFTPSSTSLNAIYTSSAADTAAKSVYLKLTTTNNGGCVAVADSLLVTYTTAPTVDAGTAQSVCANASTIQLQGKKTVATGISWNTSGGGVFTPSATTATAKYIPDSTDVLNGAVRLFITSTGNGNCLAVSDSVDMVITPAPIVNAGIDQITCVDDLSVNLNGTITGGATTGLWSQSGTGTFLPNENTLNAVYQVSSADSLAGSVRLILTSTLNGKCVAVRDTMYITIRPSGIANAGVDATVCANKAQLQLNGAVSGGATKGKWTSTGTGVFTPSDTLLHAFYMPSNADTLTGAVSLILATTNSCNIYRDTMLLTIDKAPQSNAGSDLAVCGNNALTTLNGAVLRAGGGQWTSTGTGNFGSGTDLSTTYIPSGADIVKGSVYLHLTTTGNGLCNAVKDSLKLTITPTPLVNAGIDQAVCKSSAQSLLNGSVSGGALSGKWVTSGTGNFVPNDSSLLAFYMFSSDDTAAGNITLILTSTNNKSCLAEDDTMQISFGNTIFVNAGTDQTICSDDASAQLSGFVTGGSTTAQWTTVIGSGSFLPDENDLQAVYTFSTNDSIHGSVQLRLISTNNGSCTPGQDDVIITMNTQPKAIAGADQVVCANDSVYLNGSVEDASAGIWSTFGSGSFASSSTLKTTYKPSAADIAAGHVTLLLTTSGHTGCIAATDTMHVTINPLGMANAGIDKQACANNAVVSLNGSVSGGASKGKWYTAGSGTFVQQDTILANSYMSSPTDTALGKIKLWLRTSNSCNIAVDTLTITYSPSPMSNAGADQTVCANNSVVQLAGQVTRALGGIWSSSGNGQFVPNTSNLNAAYIPGNADKAAGYVFLTLTTSGNGSCNAATDIMRITLNKAPVVNAGVDQSVCKTASQSIIVGSVTNASTKGRWTTSGSGLFVPNDSSLAAFYVFGPADTSAGSVALTLTSLDNGLCLSVQDQMKISFSNVVHVDAGVDQSLCESDLTAHLSAIVSGGASKGKWTTVVGSGSFVMYDTSLVTDYVFSQTDSMLGMVQLRITSTDHGSCSMGYDDLIITTRPSPKVDAGTDKQICATQQVQLSGTVTGASGSEWMTLGNGVFSPASSVLTATYIPGSADQNSKGVDLVLHTEGAGLCDNVSDTLHITIAPLGYADAGADFAVCANKPEVKLAGAVSGGATRGRWTTAGTGMFIPSDTVMAANYVPSMQDIYNGYVYLILSTTNSCNIDHDSVKVTFNASPVIDAGHDQTVCANNAAVNLSGFVQIASGGEWSTSGTGNFVPDNQQLNAGYVPSASDVSSGAVYIYFTSTGNGACNAVKDYLLLSITPAPQVYAGVDQQVCKTAERTLLRGVVSGATTTGRWSSSGSGTFEPDADALNAWYKFSASDTSAGSVTLTLTSTNNASCAAVADQMKISLGSSVFAYAGDDQEFCVDAMEAPLEGFVTGGAISGRWSKLSGTGYFMPHDSALNATYKFSQVDSILGKASLILTTTNSVACAEDKDTVVVSLKQLPVVNAGADKSFCYADSILLHGIVNNANGGHWTTSGSGSFSPNDVQLSTGYIPSVADKTTGVLTFILTSDGNGVCQTGTDTVVFTITKPITANAGADKTVCANNGAISLTGTSTGSAKYKWTSSGLGYFTPSDTILKPAYISANMDTAGGSVLVFFTAYNSCQSMQDTLVVTYTDAPIVDAGTAQSVCANNTAVSLQGQVSIATGGKWTSRGTGVFTPHANALDAVYLPSAEDVAKAEVYLLLTTTGNGSCLAAKDSVKISVTPAPIVFAGADRQVCKTSELTPLSGFITGITTHGHWTTTGNGTFTASDTLLDAIYNYGTTDTAAGSIQLILTSDDNANCHAVADTMTIVFGNRAFADAGTDINICQTDTATTLSGLITPFSLTGHWYTLGSGTFTPDEKEMHAIYQLSANDKLAGSIEIVLTSDDNGMCLPGYDTVLVSINSNAHIAISADQTICAGDSAMFAATLTNIVYAKWSSNGNGIFLPSDTSVIVVYVPGSADIAAGTVQIQCTPQLVIGCGIQPDTAILHINKPYTVHAGTDRTVCANNANLTLAGSISVPSGKAQWTSAGSGLFNQDTLLHAQYTPSIADVNAGAVTLYLATSTSCRAYSDSMQIVFTPAPSVDAGADAQVCQNNALVDLAGTVLVASGGVWTSTGSGVFTNRYDLNAKYIPSAQDMATGSVKLYLTSALNGTCMPATDTLTVVIDAAPQVLAGADQQVCKSSGSTMITGAVSGSTSTGKWMTTGKGSFTPNDSSLAAIYNYHADDTLQTSIMLVLTSSSNKECNAVSDTMLIFFGDKPNVQAGMDQALCITDSAVSLTGFISGGSTTGVWSSSTGGTFVPNQTSLQTAYVFSATDSINGFASLLLTSTNNGKCDAATDSMIVSLISLPVISAGADQQACYGTQLHLAASINSPYGIQWTTSGAGAFTQNDSVLTNSYSPAQADSAAGQVTFIVSSVKNTLCASVTDTAVVSFVVPVVPDFTFNQTCEGNISGFYDNSTLTAGTITSWLWDLGNGYQQTKQNPYIIYDSAAVYQVSLKVTSSLGCSYSVSKSVAVYAMPDADFTYTKSCNNDTVYFADHSKVAASSLITSWQWRYGDAINEMVQQAKHVYQQAGSYKVTLIATTASGCKDSLIQEINVDADPVAAFTIEDSIHYTGSAVLINDASTGADAYLWDLGDRSEQVTVVNPAYMYADTGVYKVWLQVRNSATGCTDSTSQYIVIGEKNMVLPPKIASGFSPNDDMKNDKVIVRGGPFKAVHLVIYNKWGQLIFETDDPVGGWDGYWKGELQPLGDYTYTVRATTIDGKEYEKSGTITLIR